MKRSVRGFLVLAVTGCLVALSSTAAAADTDGDDAVPSLESIAPIDYPSVMTAEEMDELISQSVGGTEISLTASNVSDDSSARAGGLLPGCYFEPGYMWQRASGSEYPYGAVGSKPALQDCAANVTNTRIDSNVFVWFGFFWGKVSGPYQSYGTGNMEQKTVKYICNNKNMTRFQVVCDGYVQDSSGALGTGTVATDEWDLFCGLP